MPKPTSRRAGSSRAKEGRPSDAGRRDDARVSLYNEVTARVVAELEAGRVPWVQPWRDSQDGGPGDASGGAGPLPGLPANAVTGRAYSGINILILWGEAIAQGWSSQRWLTFAQALAAGGSVRKGERGTMVVYADRFTPRARPGGADRHPDGASDGGASRDSGDGREGTARPVAFLKRFIVFNLAQCDGLATLADAVPPLAVLMSPGERIAAADAVVIGSGVPVRVGGGEAYYAPDPDFVAMPPQAAFGDPVDWYRTLLHELTHATGHPARLDRKLVTAYGSKDYGREELVAELGAAFLSAALGIAPTLRHADYLAAWLAVLREDNKAIVRAASAASKAADWLLARRPGAATPPDSVAQAGRVAS